MARPIKKGLDYFPLPTDFFADKKIRRLLRSCGLEGFTIYMFIECRIYKSEGYYILIDDDELFDISDLLKVEESKVLEVINKCCDLGLFDHEMYSEKTILTSIDIQVQYLKICKDAGRSKAVIDDDFLLILKDIPDNSVKQPDNSVKQPDNSVNTNETTGLSQESTQSKVKESKVNKRREKETNRNSFSPDDLNNFIVKCKKTLKSELKYLSEDITDNNWRMLRTYLVEVAAMEVEVDKINVSILHNLFCHVLDSLSDLDLQNFTISYLVKHFKRISNNMIRKHTKYSVRRVTKK